MRLLRGLPIVLVSIVALNFVSTAEADITEGFQCVGTFHYHGVDDWGHSWTCHGTTTHHGTIVCVGTYRYNVFVMGGSCDMVQSPDP